MVLPTCFARFNWTRVVGRKIIFLFDTVDQSRFFEQYLGIEKNPINSTQLKDFPNFLL